MASGTTGPTKEPCVGCGSTRWWWRWASRKVPKPQTCSECDTGDTDGNSIALARTQVQIRDEQGLPPRLGRGVMSDEVARAGLHAVASDLRFIASGGVCEPSTLYEHAAALLLLADGKL